MSHEDGTGVEPRELPWGASPFDALSRDELIRHCQRLYAATDSLTALARQLREGYGAGPYWTEGSGGRAIEQGEQALNAARQDYREGDIYYSFFRYARDLLFVARPGGPSLGGRWCVCPVCKEMVGSPVGQSFEGQTCAEVIGHLKDGQACTGVLRKLAWADLKPVAPQS